MAKVTTTRDDGLPDPAEGQRLRDIETAFEASVGDRAVLVACVTRAHRRDFFFYAEDSSWMREWGFARRDEYTERDLDLRLTEDPEWAMYGYLHRVARRADADRIILDQLVAQGADLREPRDLEFFSYFPTREGADAVGAYFREHDFRVVVRPAPRSSEWCLVVSCRARALPEFIARVSATLPSRAEEHGGRYDGWGASLT